MCSSEPELMHGRYKVVDNQVGSINLNLSSKKIKLQTQIGLNALIIDIS